jgi:hypothetical protein
MSEEFLEVLRLDPKKVYSFSIDFEERTITVKRFKRDAGITFPITTMPLREEQIER